MDMLSGCRGGLVEALNTRVYGNGTQTLVLSHGFGSDQTFWNYLVPFLAYYFKVVVFDSVFSPNVDPKLYDPKRYLTFDSYGQDLVCILDELNVKKSIYVGHSMSAMIGCVASIRRPELFEHLILLSGSPRYLNDKGYNGGFRRSDLETLFNNINQNFPSWVHKFAPIAIGMNNKTAIDKFESSLGRTNPKIALSVAKTVFLSDLRSVLPKVEVPSTIIQSEKDIIVPKSVAYYMKRELGGNSRVYILKAQGHFPQLTAYPMLLHVLKRVLCIN